MPSVSIQHPIKLHAQPTGMTCWSAATTMLFGSTFSAGSGSAAVGKTGGLKADYSNIQTFAREYGLRLFAPQSWSVPGLIDLLRRGPVMMAGSIPAGHVVVIGGIKSDGTPGGTALTIYDPSPVGIGSKYEVAYQVMMQKFPFATTYMMQR